MDDVSIRSMYLSNLSYHPYKFEKEGKLTIYTVKTGFLRIESGILEILYNNPWIADLRRLNPHFRNPKNKKKTERMETHRYVPRFPL